MVVGVALWATTFAGCVTTAECDEYIGCSDDAVCYHGECLSRCDGEEDCDDGEDCIPCGMGDSEEGPGSCPGEDDYACVAQPEDSE